MHRLGWRDLRLPNSSYPPATTTITKGGVTLQVDTKVGHVNTDTSPLGYSNYAAYKWVKVTVTRTSDSTQLAHEVTYVAPPVAADCNQRNHQRHRPRLRQQHGSPERAGGALDRARARPRTT